MRNHALDTLKFISIIFVILIHTLVWRDWFSPLIRVAVPIFFIISGYCIYKDTDITSGIIKRLKKIFKLLVFSTALYGIIQTILFYLGQQSSIFVFKNPLWILLNENPFTWHLWYLQAYLYVLLFALMVEKWNMRKIMPYAIPIFFLGDFCFGSYSMVLLGKEFPNCYARNFLFEGIPFFYAGFFIHKWRLNERITKNVLFILVPLFILSGMAESMLLTHFGMNMPRRHFVSTTLLSLSAVLLALKYSNCKETLFSRIGKQYTTRIYIYHALFLYIPFLCVFGDVVRGIAVILLSLLLTIKSPEIGKWK